MKLVVHFLQSRLVYVRVDLRRGNAGVAEQFLHLSQVGSAGQQMRGKAVPQGVRADGGWDAGSAGIALDELPDRFASELPAAA